MTASPTRNSGISLDRPALTGALTTGNLLFVGASLRVARSVLTLWTFIWQDGHPPQRSIQARNQRQNPQGMDRRAPPGPGRPSPGPLRPRSALPFQGQVLNPPGAPLHRLAGETLTPWTMPLRRCCQWRQRFQFSRTQTRSWRKSSMPNGPMCVLCHRAPPLLALLARWNLLRSWCQPTSMFCLAGDAQEPVIFPATAIGSSIIWLIGAAI
jgi:hypothetical protein